MNEFTMAIASGRAGTKDAEQWLRIHAHPGWIKKGCISFSLRHVYTEFKGKKRWTILSEDSSNIGKGGHMSFNAQLNFVKQQGFRDAGSKACEYQYPALMFQPKLIGVLVVTGLVLQSWPLFLTLSAILWWNVLVPALNPFDALYNSLVADPKGLPRLTAAPGPRRFAQGMAATFMLAIGTSLLFGWRIVAWTLEGLLVVALAALIFGKFCLGSYLFHLLRHEAAFANRTLPWVRHD
jgi:hypothetical protein